MAGTAARRADSEALRCGSGKGPLPLAPAESRLPRGFPSGLDLPLRVASRANGGGFHIESGLVPVGPVFRQAPGNGVWVLMGEVTTPEKKVEDVEKVETEKKVEDSADEPSVPETVNGHDKEAAKEEEEPSENGTAEEAEEKEAESTENGTAEVTATKRKSTGAEESAEAAAEGVSPEKKAKLADAEEKEASNGTVEAEATA